VCALFSACGGSDDHKVARGFDLARPVYARCGTAGFERHLSPATGPNNGRAWQVGYRPTRGLLKRARPGDTTLVVVIEQSPALVRGRVQGGQETVLAGRSISLRPPVGQSQVYVAQWKTSRARYIVLANGGSTKKLEQFVRCLP
jgi:hypothetical protein